MIDKDELEEIQYRLTYAYGKDGDEAVELLNGITERILYFFDNRISNLENKEATVAKEDDSDQKEFAREFYNEALDQLAMLKEDGSHPGSWVYGKNTLWFRLAVIAVRMLIDIAQTLYSKP